MYVIHSIAAALLAAHVAMANVSPSEPSPGTVWTTGQEHVIEWGTDTMAPALDDEWTNFTIDFMTGDNNKQVKLATVATGVDARQTQQYKWIAPSVDIPAAIYFFMFTSDSGKHNAWTTRFTIASENGTIVEAPHKDSAEFETSGRTDGSKPIPWGIGQIVSKESSLVNAAAAAAQPSSTSAPVADAGKDHFSSILMQTQTALPPNPSAILDGVKGQLSSSSNKLTISFGVVSACVVSLISKALL